MAFDFYSQPCGLPFEKFRTKLRYADGYEWLAFQEDSKGRPSAKRVVRALAKAKGELYEEYQQACGDQIVAPIKDAEFVCAPVCKPHTKPCGRACIPRDKQCRRPVPKANEDAACSTVERYGLYEADVEELRTRMGQEFSLPSRPKRGVLGVRKRRTRG